MPRDDRQIDWKASLQALRGGGLPTRATERLQEERGANRRLFTSDLSVSEFLLTKETQCVPISQVMGSSIYHIGRIRDYKGATSEITVISDAQREARRLALSRLWEEGRLVEADAVVGVRIEERLITKGAHGKGGDDGDEVIEFTVVGTAVKAPWMTPQHRPVLTDLSGQEFWALWKDGFEPTGLVFDFCRYHVWHVLKPGTWSRGGEITAAREAVDIARNTVMSRVHDQARAAGAEYVIGKDIRIDAREVPCGWEGCHLNDLDVDAVWFGTGIRHRVDAGANAKANVPPLILSMMPLGRRRADRLLEGESESEKLAEEARKEEEKAAEGKGE